MDPNIPTRVSQSRPDPLVGKTFDGYRVDEVLGRGGMGAVYKATQLSLGRPVAIKVLTRDLAEDPQFLERFHREADVLSRLAHPNVVTVYDRGEVEGRPYLAMEYIEGPSLRDVMREGPMTPAEALRIVSSVLAALEHAHDRGIVHRDIKPENVLLARGDVVKVADFGLSRLLGPEEETRLTRSQLLLGTYEYMAPEQRERSKEADERCDLYATGVVLYELLVGELPIGRFDLPSRRRPKECDGRVDRIIERSLSKDPARRYQNAEEMAGAVSDVLEHPSATEPPRDQRPSGGSTARYKPAKYEYHIDNLATIDHVLGTVCYVLGVLALFGSGFMDRVWFGFHFIVFFIVGWYLRETAADLRRYKATARTAQAVVAILAAFTGILVPFTIYSFWVLFGHRGRTYYDARSRGLDAQEAARHTYHMMEEPYEFQHQAPPPPPAPPRPPTPSQIPVQSIVTSEVVEKPVRTSGFVKTGMVFLFLAAGWGIAVAIARIAVPVSAVAVPFLASALLLALGFLHSLFTRRVRGAGIAFLVLALMAAVVLLGRVKLG